MIQELEQEYFEKFEEIRETGKSGKARVSGHRGRKITSGYYKRLALAM